MAIIDQIEEVFTALNHLNKPTRVVTKNNLISEFKIILFLSRKRYDYHVILIGIGFRITPVSEPKKIEPLLKAKWGPLLDM